MTSFLTATNYLLSLTTPSGVSLSCKVQSFNHPGVSGKSGIYSTPRREIPVPGQKLEYDSFECTILLEKGGISYKELYKWIRECVETVDTIAFDKKTVDVHLALQNGSGYEELGFTYVSAFPTSLGSIELDSTNAEDTYLKYTATFEYAYFKIN